MTIVQITIRPHEKAKCQNIITYFKSMNVEHVHIGEAITIPIRGPGNTKDIKVTNIIHNDNYRLVILDDYEIQGSCDRPIKPTVAATDNESEFMLGWYKAAATNVSDMDVHTATIKCALAQTILASGVGFIGGAVSFIRFGQNTPNNRFIVESPTSVGGLADKITFQELVKDDPMVMDIMHKYESVNITVASNFDRERPHVTRESRLFIDVMLHKGM